MATFEQLVEDSSDVATESFPFSYITVDDDVYFQSPNVMVVQGGVLDSGRLHLMVKPNKEVRFRLHSNKVGFFGGIRSNIPQYAKGAFDIETDSPLLTNPFGENSSSMDVTLRGGSMLAVVAGNEGDRGKWSSENDPFHLETEARDITQPNETFRDDSILMSLTAPYGDYSDLSTYTLRFNQHFGDVWVQILSIDSAPVQGFNELTEWETTVPEYVAPESGAGVNTWTASRFTRTIYFDSGDDIDGRPWEIDIGIETSSELWYVIVNGVVDSNGVAEFSTAEQIAQLKADRLRQRQQEGGPEDFTIPALGIGAIALVGILLIVAVYGFSRGKGGV
ncbi:MAG: hypothetical protein CMI60_06775 [Parvibaculum sp.]|nr:hypothetical protein [Parvibaculum sp.]